MSLLPWFPALTSTSALALALWLGREWISTRLTKSVQHEFDKRLEQLRADLRASEETLKARLREREAEIAALRSGALSALASRQAALDRRRLEAVDQLWSAFIALAPARAIAASMSAINFEAAAKEAEHNARAREVFAMIGIGFDEKVIDFNGAQRARPFVSPMVWAVFAAIQAVTAHSLMRFKALKSGLGPKDYVDHKAIEKLVTAALPHYSEFLQQHGPAVYHHVLEALEAKLLTEIQTMISSGEHDLKSIEQAAEIVRRATELQSESLAKQSAA